MPDWVWPLIGYAGAAVVVSIGAYTIVTNRWPKRPQRYWWAVAEDRPTAGPFTNRDQCEHWIDRMDRGVFMIRDGRPSGYQPQRRWRWR